MMSASVTRVSLDGRATEWSVSGVRSKGFDPSGESTVRRVHNVVSPTIYCGPSSILATPPSKVLSSWQTINPTAAISAVTIVSSPGPHDSVRHHRRLLDLDVGPGRLGRRFLARTPHPIVDDESAAHRQSHAHHAMQQIEFHGSVHRSPLTCRTCRSSLRKYYGPTKDDSPTLKRGWRGGTGSRASSNAHSWADHTGG